MYKQQVRAQPRGPFGSQPSSIRRSGRAGPGVLVLRLWETLKLFPGHPVLPFALFWTSGAAICNLQSCEYNQTTPSCRERADQTVDRLQKIVALVLGIAVALLAPALVWALVIAGLIHVTGGGVIVAVLGPVLVCVLVIAVVIRVRSRRKR